MTKDGSNILKTERKVKWYWMWLLRVDLYHTLAEDLDYWQIGKVEKAAVITHGGQETGWAAVKIQTALSWIKRLHEF